MLEQRTTERKREREREKEKRKRKRERRGEKERGVEERLSGEDGKVMVVRQC